MSTPITAPSALLTALKNDNPTFTSGYQFFQFPSGVTASPALVNNTSTVYVYLIPPSSTVNVTYKLPTGTILPTTTALPSGTGNKKPFQIGTATTMAAGALFNESSVGPTLVASNVIAQNVQFPSSSNQMLILVILPGKYVIGGQPVSTSSTSSLWSVYLGVGIIGTVALISLIAWLVLRKRIRIGASSATI